MERDAAMPLGELKVDGGASRNNLLMQFQADILKTRVVRPQVTETTGLGAAYLAGLAVGFWSDMEQVKSQWKAEKVFGPSMDDAQVEKAKEGWAWAIEHTLSGKQ